MSVTAGLEPASVADTGAYLARLVRLDATALVRLRPAGTGGLDLWARLPFETLVTRRVRATLTEDVTVCAAELLDALASGRDELPPRRDAEWRWPLPPDAGRVVERLPAAVVQRVGAAAASTLREAVSSGVRGRPVGERVLRDALLDHVPIVVTAEDGTRVEVSQRLVQAVVRMGFLDADRTERTAADPDEISATVAVRLAGLWVCLVADFGCAWHRPAPGLDLRPLR